MKKKIISIFVCTLLFVTVAAVTGTENIEKEEFKEFCWINTQGASNPTTKSPSFSNLQSENWLHFDNGETINALGLQNGGTFEWAARFTPSELGDWSGRRITVVRYHHDWTSGPFSMDGNVKIYGEGAPNEPGSLITEQSFSANDNDWTDIELSEPVTIAGDEDMWVSIEGTHAAGQYPAGMDPGPAVDGKGDWLYLSGTGWQEAQDLGFDNNFNIWVGVGIGESPPDTPPKPSGPNQGVIGAEYTFSSKTYDPEKDKIYYKFEWGDGTDSGWIGPYGSGSTGQAPKIWTSEGNYNVRVMAKDEGGRESGWSENHTIEIIEAPELVIGNIAGGLFKVSVPIKNIGAVDADEVTYSIAIKGGAFIGKNTYGTETIFAGNEKTVSSKFILGLGAITVTVSATVPDGISDSKSQNGNIYLFYIIIRPGGG